MADRVELGARMLVSATAIAQLDQFVDQRNLRQDEIYRGELTDCANLWEEHADRIFPSCERWSLYVPTWTRPRHGIESARGAGELLLAKNPFYPAAITTYLGAKPNKGIARNFTIALGLLDDVADLQEDFLSGSYNAIFPVKEGFLWEADLLSLQKYVIRGNFIQQAIDRAVRLFQDMEVEAEAKQMALFACAVSSIRDSLTGYAEFCAARLVM